MQETTTKYDTALEELAAYRQWVAWEYRKQNTQKAPINPHTWRDASPTDSSTWATYDEALFCAGGNEQVGFVFSADDPFTGIDLDDCIDQGEVAPWAVEIVEALHSYTEISPSGTGLKIWVRGRKPRDKCRTGNIEIYDQERFFTFTGKQFGSESKIQERQGQLERLYQSLFPQKESQKDLHGRVDGGDGFSGKDADLIEKARANSKFSRLYDLGDTSMHSYDHSRADLALCGMLAYWTGRDAERMDQLFRASKLMRRKWDERRGNSTYGERTIARAIKNCDKVYNPTNYKSVVKDDIHRMLEGCFELVVSGSWSGRSGPVDRDVYKALIDTVLLYGRVVKDGVEVCASMRDLALASGIGRRATVSDALKRLEHRGLIRKVDNGGSKKAATYLIRLTQNRTINNCVNKYGTPLSQTQRIRNPSQTYGTIGKRSAQIIDYVRALGRVVTLEEIAKHLGVRKNNLKKRNFALLLKLELLEEVDGGYVTPADIEDRLERELEDSGCNKAERLQRSKYEQERRAWRGEEITTPTVLISKESSQVEGPIYYDPEDSCIHGFLHGKGCYLHDPDHPYRKLIEEMERAA
jgi:putative DNA primase/helicase